MAMEMINGGAHHMRLMDLHSIQMSLNSALFSLVTPPRRPANNQQRSNRLPKAVKTPPPSYGPAEQLSRSLPKSTPPNRISPSCHLDCKGFYAGAKFGERPLPAELPKPPKNWFNEEDSKDQQQSCIEMTNSLKVLLKVQS